MRGSWLGILAVVLSPAVGLAGQAPDDPRIRALGFGDFNYLVTELDRKEGFRMGQMVGHVIADLDERFTFFGEVSLTAKDDKYSIEVERANVRFDFADEFKISAGRFHTPVGYWNTAFHHVVGRSGPRVHQTPAQDRVRGRRGPGAGAPWEGRPARHLGCSDTGLYCGRPSPSRRVSKRGSSRRKSKIGSTLR